MPNEATNFREARAENTKDVVLGSGHFSDTVTYRRVGADDREVIAIVRPGQATELEQRNTNLAERITVVLEADAERGVASPITNDAVKWGDKWYGFKGEIMSGRAGSWKLVFERKQTKKVGGQGG